MNITFPEAVGITISSMAIVFTILIIIMFIIYLFKFIPSPVEDKQVKPLKSIPFEDMEEDMKVAVLVATIDYQKQTSNNVVLKSVRKI